MGDCAKAGLAALTAVLLLLLVACGPPTMATSPVGPQSEELTAAPMPTGTASVSPTALATTVPPSAGGTGSSPIATPTGPPVPGPTSQPTRPSPSPTVVVDAGATWPSREVPGSWTPGPPEACPAVVETAPEIVALEPGQGIMEGFQPQVLAYLSAGGDPNELRELLTGLSLVDAEGTEWLSRAQVIPADVTGDGTPEVVVALTFYVPGQYANGGLFVFGCQEGAYVLVAALALQGQVLNATGPDPGIRAIQDMNNDGRPEIVLSFIEIVGTRGNFRRLFRILEWEDDQFVDLVQAPSQPQQAAPVSNGDGRIYDTNGNRNLELVLENGVRQGYETDGPERARTDTWAWDGEAFRLWRSEYEPAVYRFQAVQDGDDAALAGRYQRALAFYHQVLHDKSLLGWSASQLWPDSAYGDRSTPTPDPEEDQRLRAYALYRIMVVRALQRDREGARDTFDQLQAEHPEGTPGAPYAGLATAFWASYEAQENVAAGCKRAVQFAAAEADAVLQPLGSAMYGSSNRDYAPQDICPFE